MSVAEQIFTRLSTDSAVNALVSTRIYPNHFKQQDTLPAIRYTRISSTQYHTMGIDVPLERARFQVDVIADTYAVSDATATAVKDALRRWSESGVQDTFIVSDADIYDHETDLHRIRIDIDIIVEDP